MDYQVPPHIKTPITDIFSNLHNFQNHPDCAIRELELVDCLEAYGPQHAERKCRVLMADLKECVFRTKQRHRLVIMSGERHRQVCDGERDPANKYAKPPPMDTY
ncbi:NADH dehydrogenase [ubiquinone] iron-sulfur protein 5 [Diachasmimorpha longicaudata]|uniref:NADH dehydrogenase [ubiquinone] iron-sulfur protein 5 n=1 Tax=Diachasmimorpha longicaudata TaxID=58733 RepID=UPI0030B8DAD1